MFADLFDVHVPVLELMLRGTLVYWLLFLIFRFLMRRDVGAVGIADVIRNAHSSGPNTAARSPPEA